MGNDLQELGRRYFQGEMSYEQYRNSRGRFIDSVAGTQDVDVVSVDTVSHVNTPTMIPSQTTLVRSAIETQIQADSLSQTQMRSYRAPPMVAARPVTQAKAGGRRRVFMIGMGVLVMLSVISAMLLYRYWEPSLVEAPAVVNEEYGKAGQKLLATFLRANDWSADGIAGFAHDWDALNPSAREAARRTPEFQRLADALYQRIVEQRVLKEVGGTSSSHSKQIITAFAHYLGINYGSLGAGAMPSPPSVVKKPNATE